MGIYTLSINYIDGVSANKSHLLNVFYKFPNPDNELKVAVDKTKKILDHYSNNALKSNDFFTWLDLMSRNPSGFEVIDVNVPENIHEEEMYLMVAAATKPYQKVIVNSHQYWHKFNYDHACSKIDYNGNKITILDRDEAYSELNPALETTLITINNHMKRNNPWISGSFYLFLALMILITIATISNFVPWVILPIVLIGGVLIIGIIGAMQLRNDSKLKEENFMSLMGMTYKSLPLLKNMSDKKE
ncbi:hypothetical protein OD917_22000 [Flavobacterium sp. SH_e]|uniref:hypothetical protein n=1 Tax=Flavobacterium sp. SH_e TaxID=2983767 RepID=UPI0021E4E469|nr:hypothetical protein [Flavobacterium sp. SH_e]MCV2487624.1 hypothetical protein [Flavobacterium sp. SH_e]